MLNNIFSEQCRKYAWTRSYRSHCNGGRHERERRRPLELGAWIADGIMELRHAWHSWNRSATGLERHSTVRVPFRVRSCTCWPGSRVWTHPSYVGCEPPKMHWWENCSPRLVVYSGPSIGTSWRPFRKYPSGDIVAFGQTPFMTYIDLSETKCAGKRIPASFFWVGQMFADDVVFKCTVG